MRITSVTLYSIRLPLKEPFAISYHTYDDMPSVVVKVETDEGMIGYGEGVADEHVTGETWESVYQMIKHQLAPILIGKDPAEFEKIHELMDSALYGAPTAKAALDIACHDVAGKKFGVPVYQLIGGRYHDSFPITHVLSIKDSMDMAAEAKVKVAEGYRSFKMKVGKHVAEDINRIKAVREAVGDQIAIRVDVNQGWINSSKTLGAARLLEQLHIDWLEQPLLADDIDGMASLKAKVDIPLMVDEGLKGAREMREIILKGAADKVNIKLMKCGGIYPAVKLAHQAEIAGLECQIGSMVESSIGSAAGFHVAFSKKNITSVELTGPLKFSKDVGNLAYDVPFIRLNGKPGLGVDIQEDILKELTHDKECIR
ncbi:mandelate racemase/muconate lactonizing enzyme family protein [Bacillus sp. 1P06AnD]|uniref:mandelate racemase/muconate lactonizing enzyme family protein n=1 Tax=Bacillus sp. 1P06AnD TaxID=3132208 RepID=UPI00399F3C3A